MTRPTPHEPPRIAKAHAIRGLAVRDMATTFTYEDIGREKFAVYVRMVGFRKPRRIGVIHSRDGIRPKGAVGFELVSESFRIMPEIARLKGVVRPTLGALKDEIEVAIRGAE